MVVSVVKVFFKVSASGLAAGLTHRVAGAPLCGSAALGAMQLRNKHSSHFQAHRREGAAPTAQPNALA